MPSPWYNSSGLVGTSLTMELRNIGRNLGYSNSLTYSQAKNVLNNYISKYGISCTVSAGLGAPAIATAINANKPALMFASLKNAQGNLIAHAVTVYGKYGSSYVVHYGWGFSDGKYWNHIVLDYAYAVGGNVVVNPS